LSNNETLNFDILPSKIENAVFQLELSHTSTWNITRNNDEFAGNDKGI
jgi:hypothetical protein